MNAKERTQELLKLSEVFAEMSKVHWDGFVDSCGSQGATFGKWKPVFLRDMRDIWRDEFPTTEGWRAIRKVIIDPMLEHIAREHVKPGECTVLAKHATIGQAIAIAEYKLEIGDPRAEDYARVARVAVDRAGGDLNVPLISVSDERWDGGDHGRLK